MPALIPLRVFLLSRFAVYRGERLIPSRAWKRRKAETLFKLILLAPRHSLSRDQAIEMLFPEGNPERSPKAFNTVLHDLRRTLCPANAPHELYISLESDHLTLNPDCLALVDADAFEAAARKVLREVHPDRATLESALALYTGDLLPDDVHADWSTARRETLRDLSLTLCLRLADVCKTAGDPTAALETLRRILAAEPAHEEAHRRLIELYARMGQRHAALRQYQRCVEILQRELNVSPTQETTAVYRAILAGEISPIPAPRFALPSDLPPFTGRERELDWLNRQWERVRAGAGQVVFLVGDMGVGKTRLAWEFLARVVKSGAQAATGAAREQEEHLPYAPVVDALRDLLRAHTPAARDRLAGAWASDLAKLFPDFFLNAAPLTALDAALERERLFHALAEIMAALAREQPLILFVDDAHASDETTGQLLTFLAHRLSNLPICLLIALQLEELDTEHSLRQMLAQGETLTVPALSASESAMFIHALDAAAPRAWSATIYLVAEGNPLFTLELVRSMRERKGGTVSLPPRLRDALRRKLKRLPQAEREILEFAAIIGREFDYTTLCAVGDWSERAVVDALDQALAIQLIEERSNLYQFRHGLMRLALYEGLSAPRRRWWHRRAGEVLEGRAPVEVLAHHFASARLADKAVRYALGAAQRARRVYAMNEALGFLRNAEAFLEELAGDSAEMRARVYGELGDVESFLGHYPAAEEHYRRALAIGVDTLGACRAMDLHTRIATTWERRGDFGRALEELERGRALEATSGSCVELARLYDTLGLVQLNRGEHRLGLQHTQRAVAILDTLPTSLDTRIARAIALRQLGMGNGEIGKHAEALRAFRECLTVAEELGDEHLIANTLNCIGSLSVRRGEYETAIARLERGLELARRVSDQHTQALCLANLGDAYQARGDAKRGLPFLQQAARLAEEMNERSLTHFTCGLLVQTALSLRELDAAHDYAERAWKAAEGMANPRDLGVAASLLARVESARGDWDAAEKYFADSLGHLSESQHPFDFAQTQRWLAEMLLRRGETARARLALEKALALYRGVGAQAEVQSMEEMIAKL